LQLNSKDPQKARISRWKGSDRGAMSIIGGERARRNYAAYFRETNDDFNDAQDTQ